MFFTPIREKGFVTVGAARPLREWGGETPQTMQTPQLHHRADTRALSIYRATFDMVALRKELAGRNLACWCPLDQPCHADILLELANTGSVLTRNNPKRLPYNR
jgi:Domain of unknown function (DUF4326)